MKGMQWLYHNWGEVFVTLLLRVKFYSLELSQVQHGGNEIPYFKFREPRVKKAMAFPSSSHVVIDGVLQPATVLVGSPALAPGVTSFAAVRRGARDSAIRHRRGSTTAVQGCPHDSKRM